MIFLFFECGQWWLHGFPLSNSILSAFWRFVGSVGCLLVAGRLFVLCLGSRWFSGTLQALGAARLALGLSTRWAFPIRLLLYDLHILLTSGIRSFGLHLGALRWKEFYTPLGCHGFKLSGELWACTLDDEGSVQEYPVRCRRECEDWYAFSAVRIVIKCSFTEL